MGGTKFDFHRDSVWVILLKIGGKKKISMIKCMCINNLRVRMAENLGEHSENDDSGRNWSWKKI